MSKKFPSVALKMIIHYNLRFNGETKAEEKCLKKSFKTSGFSELTARGIEFYEQNLRPILEPHHNGEFVAIEPYSGEYFLNKNHTQAILHARIGTIYTAKLRSYVLRKRLG